MNKLNEVARMQQLAGINEIKVNNPSFKQFTTDEDLDNWIYEELLNFDEESEADNIFRNILEKYNSLPSHMDDGILPELSKLDDSTKNNMFRELQDLYKKIEDGEVDTEDSTNYDEDEE